MFHKHVLPLLLAFSVPLACSVGTPVGPSTAQLKEIPDPIKNRYGENVCSGPWQFVEYNNCATQEIEEDVLVLVQDESGFEVYYKAEKTEDGRLRFMKDPSTGERIKLNPKDFDEVINRNPTLAQLETGPQFPLTCPVETGNYQYGYSSVSVIQETNDNFVEFIDRATGQCVAEKNRILKKLQEEDNQTYKKCLNSEGGICTEYGRVSSYEDKNPEIKLISVDRQCKSRDILGACSDWKAVNSVQCIIDIPRKVLESKMDGVNCGTYRAPLDVRAVRYKKAPSKACGYKAPFSGLEVRYGFSGELKPLPSAELFQPTQSLQQKTNIKTHLSDVFLSRTELQQRHPSVADAVCLTGENLEEPGRFDLLAKVYQNAEQGSYPLYSNHIQQRVANNLRRYKADQLNAEQTEFRNTVLRILTPDNPSSLVPEDMNVKFLKPNVDGFQDGYKIEVETPTSVEFVAVCQKKGEECTLRKDWTYLTMTSFTRRTNTFTLNNPIEIKNSPYFTFKGGFGLAFTLKPTIDMNDPAQRQAFVFDTEQGLDSRFIRIDTEGNVKTYLGSNNSLLASFQVKPYARYQLAQDKQTLLVHEPFSRYSIYNLATGALIEQKDISLSDMRYFSPEKIIATNDAGVVYDIRSDRQWGTDLYFSRAVFSPDGRYLAIYSDYLNSGVKVWDTKEGVVFKQFSFGSISYRYSTLIFSTDSRTIYVKGDTSQDILHMLPLESNQPSVDLPVLYLASVDPLPTPGLVLLVFDNRLEIFDTFEGKVLRQIPGLPGERYLNASVSRSGRYAIAGSTLFDLDPASTANPIKINVDTKDRLVEML